VSDPLQDHLDSDRRIRTGRSGGSDDSTTRRIPLRLRPRHHPLAWVSACTRAVFDGGDGGVSFTQGCKYVDCYVSKRRSRQAMINDEHLTESEAVQCCAGVISQREATRLQQSAADPSHG
jgi:hypothetical protein